MRTMFFSVAPNDLPQVLPGWRPPLSSGRKVQIRNPFTRALEEHSTLEPEGRANLDAARDADPSHTHRFAVYDVSDIARLFAEIGEALCLGSADLLEPEMAGRPALYGPADAGEVIAASQEILEAARKPTAYDMVETGVGGSDARRASALAVLQMMSDAPAGHCVYGFGPTAAALDTLELPTTSAATPRFLVPDVERCVPLLMEELCSLPWFESVGLESAASLEHAEVMPLSQAAVNRWLSESWLDFRHAMKSNLGRGVKAETRDDRRLISKSKSQLTIAVNQAFEDLLAPIVIAALEASALRDFDFDPSAAASVVRHDIVTCAGARFVFPDAPVPLGIRAVQVYAAGRLPYGWTGRGVEGRLLVV